MFPDMNAAKTHKRDFGVISFFVRGKKGTVFFGDNYEIKHRGSADRDRSNYRKNVPSQFSHFHV